MLFRSQALEDDLRRGILILSKLTGWGLAEILDLETDEFWCWLRHAQKLDNEIAKQLKRK